jgi:5-methylcytosine-specific restriction endonuclease McrA
MQTPAFRKAQLYGRRWNAARRRFLTTNPLCVFCQKRKRVTAATVVDHIRPHRGDLILFWDEGNWQSLCQPCHDEVKQRGEKTGQAFSTAIGNDGWPTDQAHPVHAMGVKQ